MIGCITSLCTGGGATAGLVAGTTRPGTATFPFRGAVGTTLTLSLPRCGATTRLRSTVETPLPGANGRGGLVSATGWMPEGFFTWRLYLFGFSNSICAL